MLKELIISMRPRQWYKNLVIFIGIIFSLHILNINMWLLTIAAFLIFCMLSGGSYIINDIVDREKDRKHPKKSKRPIASGKLKIKTAWIFSIILLALAVFFSYLINKPFFLISILYLVLAFFYSFVLKHLIIVDILTISSGFLLRAIAGCLAISVLVSPWLIIFTFSLALFLTLGKRRHESILLGEKAEIQRKTLKHYSPEFLDKMINITVSSLIIFYSLYTFLTNNVYMMLTIPFMIYCIFRYMFLIYSKNLGDEPEMIFKDKGMLLGVILWAILILIVLYLPLALGV